MTEREFTHAYEPPCDHVGVTRADETCPWCSAVLDQAEWERVGVRQGWLPIMSVESWDIEADEQADSEAGMAR